MAGPYNIAISLCCDRAKPDISWKVYQKMLKHDIPVDPFTLTPILKFYVRSRDLNSLQQAIETIVTDMHVLPSREIMADVYKCCQSFGNMVRIFVVILLSSCILCACDL